MTRKHKFDLITIGGSTWDAIVTAAETRVIEEGGQRYLAYPYAKKVFMDEAYFSFGGGAANVAVAASRLGLKVSYMGTVGAGKLGETILDNFKINKVATNHAKIDRQNATSISVVLTAPDGDRTILRYRGSDTHLTASDIGWSYLPESPWLYVASMSSEASELYDHVTQAAEKYGLKLALNPGATQIKRGPKGLRSALARATVLIMNEEEARELLRQHGEAGQSLGEMLAALHEITGGVVVITRGLEGAVARDENNRYTISAVSSPRVNTVGAGDAFGATFVVAMIKGAPTVDALRYAATNAASVVADYTAQDALLGWDKLLARTKQADLLVTIEKA